MQISFNSGRAKASAMRARAMYARRRESACPLLGKAPVGRGNATLSQSAVSVGT